MELPAKREKQVESRLDDVRYWLSRGWSRKGETDPRYRHFCRVMAECNLATAHASVVECAYLKSRIAAIDEELEKMDEEHPEDVEVRNAN